MKRKMILTSFLVVLLLSISTITLAKTHLKLVIKGMERPNVEPKIVDGRVMVPLNEVAKSLNMDFKYDRNQGVVQLQPNIWDGDHSKSHEEEWIKLRNVIAKYFMAVEENDPEIGKYTTKEFKSIYGEGAVQFHDLTYQDVTMEGSDYRVRVSCVIYYQDSNTLHTSRMDVIVDGEQNKIKEINTVAGAGTHWIKAYDIFPGHHIVTYSEG